MGILRKIFGPSRDEIWAQLAKEVQGDFTPGGFRKGSAKVVVRHKAWTITLDNYTVNTGESSHTYTRMRAPYVNPEGFHFTLYREGIFSGIGKFLGMQDIQIGDRFFDETFIIKSNNEKKVRALLSNPTLRELFHAQPDIHLTVKDDEGWFGTEFPKGVDELCFQANGVVKDVERLKQLYLLFAEALNQLTLMGDAYEHDPGVTL